MGSWADGVDGGSPVREVGVANSRVVEVKGGGESGVGIGRKADGGVDASGWGGKSVDGEAGRLRAGTKRPSYGVGKERS